MIVLISSDLMFPSQIRGAAQALGLACQTIGSANRIGEITDDIHLVIVDLSTTSSPLNEIQAAITAAAPAAKTLAFGPHVQEGKLAAAREAGFDRVVTRGQMAAQMNALLTD